MADLLFADLGRSRRPRQFKPARAKKSVKVWFGRQGIGYITNLTADELRRRTRRNHALPPLQQVLIPLRFYASGSYWRHCSCRQVSCFACRDKCVKCLDSEAKRIYHVADGLPVVSYPWTFRTQTIRTQA